MPNATRSGSAPRTLDERLDALEDRADRVLELLDSIELLVSKLRAHPPTADSADAGPEEHEQMARNLGEDPDEDQLS